MNKSLAIGTIAFDHVSKRYQLGTFNSLRNTLAGLIRPTAEDGQRILWALQDVSFRVEPGTSLGLIGPNGAGKTTTLKLLSNITRPTSGRILSNGRISSLIELGAGFHPELTGRDNIYLNGAILGLKRREIARKIDAIIAFAEIARFIDTPVKRYSSGMYVRLGFAVAAHIEPDILLVDEVLAVGDASFRHRCTQRMKELQRNGTTIVFVSHNMHLVRDMCDTALLFKHGQICAEGKPAEIAAEYEHSLLEARLARPTGEEPLPIFESVGGLILTAIEILATNHNTLTTHETATVRVHYRCVQPQPIGRIVVRIMRDDSVLCSTADSSLTAVAPTGLRYLDGEGSIDIDYQPLQLTAGTYVAEVRVTDISNNLVIASGQSSRFQVRSAYDGQSWGIYLPHVTWNKRTEYTSEQNRE